MDVFRMYKNMMFSDIHSVRSVPTSPRRVQFKSPNHLELKSPSECSRVRSPRHYEHWRSSIHPEINSKFHLIINGQPVQWKGSQEKAIERIDYDTRSKSRTSGQSSGQEKKLEYQEKINSLEQQNTNLRQELYYLREALLINFQQKQPKKK